MVNGSEIRNGSAHTTGAARWLRPLYGLGWPILLWGVLALLLLGQWQPTQGRITVGAVSPQSVRAPNRVTFVSAIQTERARERAASDVAPLYFPPDRSQAIAQVSSARAVASYLDAIRADPYLTDEARAEYIRALQPLQFDPEVSALILSLSEEEWIGVVEETIGLIDSQMRAEIRENRLPSVLRNLENQISGSLSPEQLRVVTAWAGGLITTNTFLDSERTDQARQAARDAIAPIEVSFEPGQIVVREGDIVTAEQIEALEALGLQQPSVSRNYLIGAGLFLALLVAILSLYINRFHPEHWESPRAMSLVVLLLVSTALGTRVLIPNHLLLSYLFPTSAVAMLIGVLMGIDLAIIVTAMIALLVGFFSGSVEMATYILFGGVLAALMLWRIERLGAFVWTGALVGLVNLAVALAFALAAGPIDWVHIAAVGGMALLNGASSASLALAGFYVLSNLLGITTFLQLMELARPTNPLFRELLLKAPGTYHHTIIVSNLAERAAEAVGADMLLVRVGAYYHDIGKVENPHYFVENQRDGVNLHDALDDPYKSAEIIIGHVSTGVKMAQRAKLPRRIIDFIAEHHGTTTVAWFLNRACELDGEDSVDAARFRYPGPKPQSRESAILMLADSVEAKARAVKPAGATEIDELIRSIIVYKLGAGQLDECDLSLRDMDRIRQAFREVLHGIYHPRIEYPDAPREPARLPGATPMLEEVHDAVSERADPDRSTVEAAG